MGDWYKYLEINMSIMASAIVLTIAYVFILSSRGLTANMQNHINTQQYMSAVSGFEAYNGKDFNAYDIYGLVMECGINKKSHPKITIDNTDSTDVSWEYPIDNYDTALFDTYFRKLDTSYICELVVGSKGIVEELKFIER